MAEYRIANKARIAATRAEYQRTHKARVAAWAAKGYRKRKVAILAQQAQYRRTHKEQAAARRAAWRNLHPGREAATIAAWRRAHPANVHKSHRKHEKRCRETLSDSYVKKTLLKRVSVLRGARLPPQLIEAKRAQLLLLRRAK